MAQSVVINGVSYPNVPSIEVPKSTSGMAEFYDTSDATLDSGDKMLAGNTAYADGVKYTGTIPEKEATDITVSGGTVNIPAGHYAESASKSVANGSATPPASASGTGATVTPGTNTLKLSKQVSMTPQVSAGYVSAGTAGNVDIELTASVTTKAAATITPGTSNQEIAAGTYLTGKQTISGDSNLQAQYIKSGVSIFGIAGSLTSATVSQDGTTKVLTIS